ncbi:GMC oxidoreductase [Hypoxylon sp. NC0597]|nr:GMC oxidoreductase [Hypoxylon sp. NC0597]
MGIYTILPDEIQEVDVIIAGGGCAGCIIAARMSDADPNLSVLVVETGTNNADIPTLTHPAFLMNALLPGNKYNLYYKATKSENLAGREIVVPSGGVLGGGTSVNLMVYTRAQRSDYDSWGMAGWSADEMISYMKKLETYHGPDEEDRHGSEGPIHVTGDGYCSSRLQNDFISAANDAGWPEIPDLQTMDAVNGVQRAMRYVGPNGKRQNTAHQYIHPRLEDGQHSNLHVLIESKVNRVIFDGKRAVGVEYQPHTTSQEVTQGHTRIVKARRMVIISCGALRTPLVLERSGVGDPDVLSRAGVPVIANVPGVGRNYQDHQLIIYSYHSSLTRGETLDSIIRGDLDVEELVTRNEPILGWNSIDAYGKLRPNEADIRKLGPEFEKLWRTEYQHRPDRPLMMTTLSACFPANPPWLPEGHYFSIAGFNAYALSRGHIHITGPALSNSPDFDIGFFSDSDSVDIKGHIWMYKKQRQIARRMKVFRGEVANSHPRFPPGSRAACTCGPLPADAPDLEYDSEDDKAIEQWLRENVGTTWHSLGTCNMAALEEGGVVDADLNVYGVEGLKVADLSIPRSNVAANTANVAMAIGEKAADIFIKELGIGV